MDGYWERIEKNLYKRKGSPYFWIQIYANGKRIRESTKTDKVTVARRFLKEREGQVATGISPVVKQATFDDAKNLILKDYIINKKKSLGRLKLSIEHLKDYFSGGYRFNKITPSDIDDYIETRLHEGAMNATINRELACLRRMANLAIAKELIQRFPKIKLLKEVNKEGKPNRRTGFFEHDEFLALRDALPEYLRPVVTLAYESGMRRTEILGLQWPQVSLDEGTINLERGVTKNEEPRIFYMSAELKDMLTDLWKEKINSNSDVPYVFANRDRAGRIVNMMKSWRNALKDAELNKKLFHDFRRTAVRNMVRAGIPESVAMKISGHKDRSVFERYNITDEKDLQQAAQLMREYLNGQSKKGN